MKLCVWNGDGFNQRWNAGDFTKLVAELDPDILIFQETKIDPAHMHDPWAVWDTMFAMGFSHVVWHSSVIKASAKVMVASKYPLPTDFGLSNKLLDDDGRVITIHHPGFSVISAYAPCTKWGEAMACQKRAIFQECLQQRINELGQMTPVILAGDLNVAPTPEACTATFKVPPNATDYDVEADLRIMKKDTVSSCKSSERAWNSKLIEECELVDVFCRFLDSIVSDLHWTVPLTFIDDILIFTKIGDEHVRAPDELLMFLDKVNLTLKSSKTSIGTTSVQPVGHILDGNGASPDPDKVREIEAISLPQDAKALTTAMGSLWYYRSFIRGYAKRTHLLREKATAPWISNADGTAMWTAEEEAQFLTIRNCLTQAPILAHPDWSLPFEVHTEASREGLGAVLVQRQGGQEVAIGYASRARTGAEKPFAVWELEGLTVVWACRLFRMYLYGGKFKIVTDNRAVQTILKADYKAAGGRLAQWSLALQDFDYELIHRAGVLNGIADALSRNPLPSTDPYSIGPTDLEPQPMLAITTDWDYVSTFDGTKPLYAESDTVARSVADWHEEQQKDATCVRVIAALNAPGANDAKAQESARPERRAAEYKVPTTLRAFVLHRYHSIEKKKKNRAQRTRRSARSAASAHATTGGA
jgi:exonuclease III